MGDRTIQDIAADMSHARMVRDVALLDALIEEARQIDTPEALFRVKNAEAERLSILGHRDEAIEIWRSLLDDDFVQADPLRRATMLNDLGLAYHERTDHPEALEAFMKCLEVAEEQGEVQFTGAVLNNIGMIYFTHGDYPKALEYYRKALRYHQEAGSRQNQANTKMNMADLLRILGDVDAARKNVQEAYELYVEIESVPSSARASVQNAYYVHLEGDDDGADLWIDRALNAIRHIPNGYDRANVARIVCAIRAHQGRHDEFFALVDEWWNEIKNFPNEAIDILSTKAWILEQRGDMSGAREIFLQIMEAATAQQDMYRMIEGHKQLRDVAKALGDFEAYIKHNEEYQRLHDEFRGAEATRKVAMQEKQQEIEQERAERERERAVLYGALPREIADKMVRGESVSGDSFDHAAVLFLDVARFTHHSSAMNSNDVVLLLETIFRSFDEICKSQGVIKVKTIGDSYMCFKGDGSAEENAIATARVAAAFNSTNFTWPSGEPLAYRIGIHIGSATAGVIGTERLQYDVWGDTVNVASRLESQGEPGRVQVSERFAEALDRAQQTSSESTELNQHLHLVKRGTVDIKGKGPMTTFWLS